MIIRRCLGAALAAAVLSIPTTSAFAQQAGLKAGINAASLTPEEDEDPDTSRRIGAVAGLWVSAPLTSRVSFQVEGLFSEKGVKIDTTPFAPGTSAEVRLRYLEFPLLARGDVGARGSTARFFVLGGAAPAFKLSARAKAEFDGDEQTRDIGDEIEAFDLGLVGGAGIAVGRALIEARYTHGLLHINTDDNGDEDRIKNRVFSVAVGVRLR
jgi:hypothetical protein